MTDKYELGLARMKELLGEERATTLVESLKKISPDFANYAVEFAYGDVGSRKILDDKTRSAIIVSSLISQNISGTPLKSHLTAMMNAGWSKKEIVELYQSPTKMRIIIVG